MKICVRLIAIFEILILVSISLIGYISYQVESESIEKRVELQLDSILTLKTNHLDTFFKERKEDIQSSINYYNTILEEENFSYSFTKEKLIEKLHENGYFSEFFIMDLNGEISISTSDNQEGTDRSNEKYFIDGQNNFTIQSFYYNQSLQQPTITISSPIINSKGSTIGVFAGQVNLTEIFFILQERSGLGKTGETYLVNNGSYAVTQLRNEESQPFTKVISSALVKRCFTEKFSSAQFMAHYQNYAGEQVIGGAVFLPDLNVCLIAEINEGEAFASLVVLGNNIIFLAIIMAIITVALSYFISKKITEPIRKLSDATEKISKGDLNTEDIVGSNDEIGKLIGSFNTMRKSFKETKQGLLDAQKNLEIIVDERTKELKDKKARLRKSEIAIVNIMDDLQRTVDALELSKRKIEQQNIDLKKLDKIKSNFLNVTSHELRTPISAIKGYAQMFLKKILGEINEEQEKALKIVLRNTNRLDNLIQDILDVSRLESGTLKFTPKETDIQRMIDEAVETIQPNAEKARINISIHIEDNVPELNIDSERIKQVVINIINNALKFSPAETTIDIRVKNQEDGILFEIQDFGKGIPKDKQRKIFDTFYQVDSGMDRKFGGAGLGLSICRGIVLSHGGEIWVESNGNPGEGSTFKFTLPFTPVQDIEGKW